MTRRFALMLGLAGLLWNTSGLARLAHRHDASPAAGTGHCCHGVSREHGTPPAEPAPAHDSEHCNVCHLLLIHSAAIVPDVVALPGERAAVRAIALRPERVQIEHRPIGAVSPRGPPAA